ncbi:prefoldin subunit Pfd3 [Schizosaccharomyces osmophilus]|uniref:Prefoldin subunit 3 n=1 Tax=Schizosaccharomyces osmophilus TaxID=2545709 RepID=A0AAF0AV05_9SCHI|nr:prefoldin subunit Pfd3 [Schizosaccharomyces osmophilus]WBW71434.1 prefoldin subunit Pfd3 [Schizosaccharomyces osmophilus]
MANSNPRGIPGAQFFEFTQLSMEDAQKHLEKFQEAIAKYKFMETSIVRRVAGLDDKIPDIAKTLQTVEFMKKKKGESFNVLYELNDTLHTRAEVEASEKVYLWLGANVMLEYSVEEAEALLTQKLNAAQETMKVCKEDLEFLRAQITTMEVNTARVYNHTVSLKKASAPQK